MPYMWVAPPEVQARGMSLHVSGRVRVPAQSVDPMVKHYHWLDFQMGLFDADGSSISVHAQQDTYCDEESDLKKGCAGGAREACGIIRLVK